MTRIFDLTGKVAVVSGAASGMGKASSLALAEAGADVVLADLNEEGAQVTAAEIDSLGRRASPVWCDISKPENIRAMFERVDDEFGRIDFAANIAGEAIRKKPEDISLDEIEWTWRNLVYGRFCMSAKKQSRRPCSPIFAKRMSSLVLIAAMATRWRKACIRKS